MFSPGKFSENCTCSKGRWGKNRLEEWGWGRVIPKLRTGRWGSGSAPLGPRLQDH